MAVPGREVGLGDQAWFGDILLGSGVRPCRVRIRRGRGNCTFRASCFGRKERLWARAKPYPERG